MKVAKDAKKNSKAKAPEKNKIAQKTKAVPKAKVMKNHVKEEEKVQVEEIKEEFL
jgi:hypothetical protein